jgi:hypothetical protein
VGKFLTSWLTITLPSRVQLSSAGGGALPFCIVVEQYRGDVVGVAIRLRTGRSGFELR